MTSQRDSFSNGFIVANLSLIMIIINEIRDFVIVNRYVTGDKIEAL